MSEIQSNSRIQAYYDEPYLTELDSVVTHVEPKGSQVVIQLDRTIFYPEGGGQPCDQGELAGQTGRFRIAQVRTAPSGAILHQGTLTGQIQVGDAVHATLKWAPRHQNMRVHSAGHLVHDVLMTMASGLTPTKGNHGQKAFIEYSGSLDPDIKDVLQDAVNERIIMDLPVVTKDTTYEELLEKCQFVPPGLPKNKQLRMMQIGEFPAMPDGGVQVKSTREIGGVVIHSVVSENGTVIIRYGVTSEPTRRH
jgi:alanyl-tRNA synthetase